MHFSFKKIILFFSLFALTLLIYRIIKTQSLTYVFLPWNLFLAYIPFYMSLVFKKNNSFNFKSVLVFCIWLLFLPNSPYILTDLFHLKTRAIMPLWYDLILICSFALIGFILFYKSLFNILPALKSRVAEKHLTLVVPLLFLLTSYGLYLGRYLRFNSWDIISKPFNLAQESFNALFRKDTMAFTFIFTLFMWFIYLTLINFNSKEKINE